MSAHAAILIASVSLSPFYLRAADLTSPPSPASMPPAPARTTPPRSLSAAPDDPFTPAIGYQSNALRDVTSAFLEDPLQWGPFRLKPHLDYRLTFAEGVRRAPGRTEDTIEHSVSPGLALQSPHVTLDYTPELSYYTKGSYEDTVNHRASVRAAVGLGDWRFSLGHTFALGSQALIETARQTEFETHSTVVSANYLYSEKISFSFSLSQALNDTGDFNSSRTWSSMNWVNYNWSDKTSVGVGFGGGYSDVETGSDMTYQQVQARLGWVPGARLSLNVNGGVEIRQFLAREGASDLVNPIMGASASYQLFENTAFSLNADRTIRASLFTDQITETTQFSTALSQRFFGRIRATLSGGYRVSDYESSSSMVAVNRSDDVTFLSASLGTRIFKKGNISIFYTRSENDSTLEGYSYASNQYGLQLGYRF